MSIIPCHSCEEYQSFDNGKAVCCTAVDIDKFYKSSDIADMINKCPRGYRARKKSDTNTIVWREYDEVRKF